MASGKKGKTKWKAYDSELLISPISRKVTTGSWTNESDPDDSYDFGRKPEVNLPKGPRSTRSAEDNEKISHEPPFCAYLSSVSYDVTEDDLADFFSKLKVKSVKLPKEDRGNTGRPKGYGYVEFEDRDSLIEAINMTDTICKGRRMRIGVYDGEQVKGSRGSLRDRGPNEPDRTMGDWRSGPRSDSDDRDGYRTGQRREYGNDRGGMYGDRRGGGNFRDDDRGFRRDDRPSYNRDGDRPSFNRDGDRPSFSRDGDRASFGRDGDRSSFGRDSDRSSFGRDNRGYRDDRGGNDRYERRSMDDRRDDRRDFGGGGDTKSTWRREPDREAVSSSEKGDEPKTRTKLNLQPRTRPVEEKVNGVEVQANPPANNPTSASIFGGARPVDTAARERQIEERLAKQREDRPAQENRVSSSGTGGPRESAPRETTAPREDPPSSPPLEPAPPPKENAWARRSQQTAPLQVNNGRISPHEDGESYKPRNSSPSNEPRKYQPPRRNPQDDRKRDDRGGTRGAWPARGGSRHVDTKQTPHKPKEMKKEPSDEMIRMPKIQENQAPNFIGSNKFAFLEDSESATD